MISLLNAIFMSLFFYHPALGDGVCSSADKKIKGKTTYQCKQSYESFQNSKIYISEDCGTTAGQSAVLNAYSSCIEMVMNSALDFRLLKLKKKDPTQFKKEMKVQADFNKATRLCLNISSCQGSMYDLLEIDCVTRYQLYRAEQAELIAKSALEIKTKLIHQTQVGLPPEFKEFAKGLCAMPADIWKSKSIPKNCELLVEGSLPFDKGDIDPCPDQQEEQAK